MSLNRAVNRDFKDRQCLLVVCSRSGIYTEFICLGFLITECVKIHLQ